MNWIALIISFVALLFSIFSFMKTQKIRKMGAEKISLERLFKWFYAQAWNNPEMQAGAKKGCKKEQGA